MISLSTFQAVSRLSPRMIGYHLKRLARNKLAPRRPEHYARRIDRLAAGVPKLAPGSLSAQSPAASMAQAVAAFYREEYRDHIDDAARGRFSFFGQEVDFGGPASIDWHHTVAAENDFHLWRMKLAHMGFICPMLIDGETLHHEAVAEMLAGYRAEARFDRPGCFSSYWFPYSVSHRILAVLSGYLIARRQDTLPAALCDDIEQFLRWNVAFVEENIEHELKNNHVERNLAALCFYYTHAEDVPPGLKRKLDRDVAGIIHACILPDGLLAERSAMYQGLSVMALQVFSQTPFLSEKTRGLAAERLERAKRAWSFMTHPDGEIALFNDSWFGEVPPAHSVIEPARFNASELLPQAGYARLADGGIFALLDAGPIGPRWNPGHGHADFLSAEIDVAGLRFVADPGTYQYSTGPRRMYERSAQSHNGPSCKGLEPVSYYGCFRVGRLAEARLVEAEATDGRAVAGELQLPDGLKLRRELQLIPNGLAATDRWQGACTGPRVRLTIPREWEVSDRDQREVVFLREDVRVRLEVLRGRIADLSTGQWAFRYLKSSDAHILVLEPEETPGGADLSWRITHQINVAASTESASVSAS
ncbi:heparinase II/III family protein [Martelella lutilitoris]|uniref:Heparinase II/III family protein n=1 Tax=Martelella lutilitoris TaxID=2583532 RepID=A0A7T7KNX9_9HYPH|nr:heparinase II/III family protein [Martelella lutilitoris]QQM32464.1 heparinase II/III family protein [Martelella lutilitoris]